MTPRTQRTLASARQHFAAQEFDQAEACFRRVLTAAPDCGEALHGLALISAQNGDYPAAADLILRAAKKLALTPPQQHAAACICQRAERHDEAVKLFALCLEQMPDHAPSYVGMAQSLAVLGDHQRALETLERLTTIHPQLADAYYGKGFLLGSMGRYDDEIAAYRAAIVLKPNFTQAYVNLGVALRDLHRFDEALQQFALAVQIDPNYAGTRTNRAQTNLLLGNFEAGWREYEWRWRDGNSSHGFDPGKLWTGDQPIAGKTVLIHFEQGFGDTLQFVRYIDRVADKGARVVLRVQDALLSLLRDSTGKAQVIGENEPIPDFDLHCPLLSLPLVFQTNATDIPAATPYLRADAHRAAYWREVIGSQAHRARVGLAWAGLRTSSEHGDRSIRLAELAPLFGADAQFVSLQKAVPDADREVLERLKLLDVSERLDTFADTAALISQLDLVISIDTSVAHLAGALGTPVWIALQFTPDWRWQMNRADSPWYPQARLFRQTVRGDWKAVVDALRTALDTWLQSRAAAACAESTGATS